MTVTEYIAGLAPNEQLYAEKLFTEYQATFTHFRSHPVYAALSDTVVKTTAMRVAQENTDLDFGRDLQAMRKLGLADALREFVK